MQVIAEVQAHKKCANIKRFPDPASGRAYGWQPLLSWRARSAVHL